MNTVNKEGKLTCISQFKIINAFFSLRISRNNRLREDCNSFLEGIPRFYSIYGKLMKC